MRPVPGNHEYRTPGAAGYFAYFPGVRPYYAANLGCGWRGYFLNSEIPTAEQVAWMRADLAAYPRAPIVVAWHKPLRSSGLHGNNPVMKPLWDLIAGRRAIVLAGHDHHYERFAVSLGRRAFIVGTGGGGLRGLATIQSGSRKRITDVAGVLRLNLRDGARYSWTFRDTANVVRDYGYTWTS